MKERRKVPSPKSRIFLVDDHALVRNGLAELINRECDMGVCGEAASAEEALEAIPAAAPDLAVVDLSLEGKHGMELIRDLKVRHPDLPVLVLSMHEEGLYAERALRAGARGYVMKHQAIGEVRGAIRRVLDGKIYLSESMSDRLLRTVTGDKTRRAPSALGRLSDRELEVFERIGRGRPTREIARRLHVSVKTVETHRAHIKEKLGLKSGAELAAHAAHWVRGL